MYFVFLSHAAEPMIFHVSRRHATVLKESASLLFLPLLHVILCSKSEKTKDAHMKMEINGNTTNKHKLQTA
jgi:hypothetical protein